MSHRSASQMLIATPRCSSDVDWGVQPTCPALGCAHCARSTTGPRKSPQHRAAQLAPIAICCDTEVYPRLVSTDHRGARLARFYIIKHGKQVALAPSTQLFLYDGPVYSKFVEALDEVPLRAVCHRHRDVRVVRFERLIPALSFCAGPSPVSGRRAVSQKAAGARTRSCSVSLDTPLPLIVKFHAIE